MNNRFASSLPETESWDVEDSLGVRLQVKFLPITPDLILLRLPSTSTPLIQLFTLIFPRPQSCSCFIAPPTVGCSSPGHAAVAAANVLRGTGACVELWK